MKGHRKAIVVTGTPGTGKTRLAKELSLLLHARHIEGSLFIKSEGLEEGYDRERGASIVSPRKLSKALIRLISGSKGEIIMDSHLAHYLPREWVKLCIVAKCSLKELKKRLAERGYPEAKIRENLDAEIFDVCLTEARERGHEILVVDTTRTRPKTLARLCAKLAR